MIASSVKQCKRIFHGNEWMNEWKNIIMLFKTPIHVLVCKVEHRTYVLLNRFPLRMVKITSIFGSYRFLTIALHDIFSLSHHPLASWDLYNIPRVEESRSKCSSSREALDLKSNPQVNHPTHLKDSCVSKFGKTSNRAVENLQRRRLWVLAANDALPSRVFIWVVLGAMHSD